MCSAVFTDNAADVSIGLKVLNTAEAFSYPGLDSLVCAPTLAYNTL